MSYALLVFYLIAFCFWLRYTTSIEQYKLSRPFLFFMFLFKLSMGGVYFLIYKYYFLEGDTFSYLQESSLIGQSFWRYPAYYLSNLLGSGVPPPEGANVFIYPPNQIFWKDLGTYLLVHFHALLYPFTRGSYGLYLFFIALFGWRASLNFYYIFKKILSLPSNLLLICCFFLPSLSFWTAGMHKDVYIYYGLSLCCLGLLAFQEQSPHKWKPLLLGIVIVGVTRYYLLALLLPAMLAYFVTLGKKQKFYSYVFSYIICLFIALVASKMLLDKSIFEFLSERQLAFLAEQGNSTIVGITAFEPTLMGCLQALPAALLNVLTRPFLWECTDVLQLMASLEIISFILLLIVVIFYKKALSKTPNPLLYFLLAYTVSNLLLVGLLVCNIGTLVRYRAISLGILSAILANLLKWPHARPTKKKIQHQPFKSRSIISTPKN